jgi:hypothetical protein
LDSYRMELAKAGICGMIHLLVAHWKAVWYISANILYFVKICVLFILTSITNKHACPRRTRVSIGPRRLLFSSTRQWVDCGGTRLASLEDVRLTILAVPRRRSVELCPFMTFIMPCRLLATRGHSCMVQSGELSDCHPTLIRCVTGVNMVGVTINEYSRISVCSKSPGSHTLPRANGGRDAADEHADYDIDRRACIHVPSQVHLCEVPASVTI